MIESFASRKLERFYKGENQAIGAEMRRKVNNILSVLEAAETVEEIDPLRIYRLHQLEGNRKGFLSMKVNANWRIIFRFEEGKAKDIDILDYHT